MSRKANAVRKMRELHHGHWYRRLMRQCSLCVYCGALATGEDHFVPLSRVWEVSKGGLVIVPCCAECNFAAGAKLFKTFEDKRRYLQAKLQLQNGYTGNFPRLTEEEVFHLVRRLKLTDLAMMSLLQQIALWSNIWDEPELCKIKVTTRKDIDVLNVEFEERVKRDYEKEQAESIIRDTTAH